MIKYLFFIWFILQLRGSPASVLRRSQRSKPRRSPRHPTRVNYKERGKPFCMLYWLLIVNPLSAGIAFMIMQSIWIQASRRVTWRLAWDPNRLLYPISVQHWEHWERYTERGVKDLQGLASQWVPTLGTVYRRRNKGSTQPGYSGISPNIGKGIQDEESKIYTARLFWNQSQLWERYTGRGVKDLHSLVILESVPT